MRDEEKPAKATVEKGSSRPKEHHWQWLRGKEGLGMFKSSKKLRCLELGAWEQGKTVRQKAGEVAG